MNTPRRARAGGVPTVRAARTACAAWGARWSCPRRGPSAGQRADRRFTSGGPGSRWRHQYAGCRAGRAFQSL